MFAPRKFALALLSSLIASSSLAAVRFSGGACSSQGHWLEAALQQSETIVNAIESLRNDPACSGLIRALEASPKVDMQDVRSADDAAFANIHQELASIQKALKAMQEAQPNAELSMKFRDIVFQVAFTKSFQAIQNLKKEEIAAAVPTSGQDQVQSMSLRLKHYLDKSERVANLTMATSKTILAALPQSKLCLHNRPSQTAAILGAIAHSAAALTSGGKINGVGEFVGTLLQYSRENSYVRALKGVEMERFQASISCLVESTSAAYCELNESEEALDFLKKESLSKTRQRQMQEVIQNPSQDQVANPLGGMLLLTRDLPVLQQWMQRVLFGIAPRIKEEGDMKNANWASYLVFIQKMNTIQANFRDKENLYYSSTAGNTKEQKLGKIREIIDTTIEQMVDPRGVPVNFFTRVFSSTAGIPFDLLGITVPADLSPTKTYNDFWLQYTREATNGFDDPDQLLLKIRERVWRTVDLAQREANNFFVSRMVVDPQNLLTEATRGPGVSAYDALLNLQTYLQNLQKKLQASLEDRNTRFSQTQKQRIRVHLSLLKNTLERTGKLTAALRNAADIENKDDMSADRQAQDVMSVIYESANMMLARDALFGNRLLNLVQMDLSDTLWKEDGLSEKQADILLSVGPGLMRHMMTVFGSNPVSRRMDLNAAKMVHLANLQATEQLFAKVIFNQLVKLTCQLDGGDACAQAKYEFDPARPGVQFRALNQSLRIARATKGTFYSRFLKMNNWLFKPTDDSKAHEQTKAKLCVQALAFESREQFAEICHGTVLVSDFSDSNDSFNLNVNFNNELGKIRRMQTDKSVANRLDQSRTLGVCAHAEFLHKNQVFYMYDNYRKRD